jgi:hypothetical protein
MRFRTAAIIVLVICALYIANEWDKYQSRETCTETMLGYGGE